MFIFNLHRLPCRLAVGTGGNFEIESVLRAVPENVDVLMVGPRRRKQVNDFENKVVHIGWSFSLSYLHPFRANALYEIR